MTKREILPGDVAVGDTVHAWDWMGRDITGMVISMSDTGALVLGQPDDNGKRSFGSYSYKRMELLAKGASGKQVDIGAIKLKIDEIRNTLDAIDVLLIQ